MTCYIKEHTFSLFVSGCQKKKKGEGEDKAENDTQIYIYIYMYGNKKWVQDLCIENEIRKWIQP